MARDGFAQVRDAEGACVVGVAFRESAARRPDDYIGGVEIGFSDFEVNHLSSGGLDFLLEDFEKGFLRRLRTVTSGGGGWISGWVLTTRR